MRLPCEGFDQNLLSLQKPHRDDREDSVSSHSSAVSQQGVGHHYFHFEQQQQQEKERVPFHHYFQLDKDLTGQVEPHRGHHQNPNQPPFGGAARELQGGMESQASANGHLTLPRGQLKRARHYFELEKGLPSPSLSFSPVYVSMLKSSFEIMIISLQFTRS